MPVTAHRICVAKLIISTPRSVLRSILYYSPAEDGDLGVANLANNLAAAIDAPVGAAVRGIIGNFATYAGVDTHIYDGAGNEYLGNNSAGQGLGEVENGEELLPDQDALVIRKITGKVGRQNRGRWFIGGLPQDADREGLLTEENIANYFDKMEDLKTALIAVFNVGGFHWHPAHYDRKDDQFLYIKDAHVMKALRSRRDRAHSLNAADLKIA